MANTINPVIKYLPQVVDKVNKEASFITDLMMDAQGIKSDLSNSSEVKVRKLPFVSFLIL